MCSDDIKRPRTFSVSDEQYELLQEASRSVGMSTSGLLRTFIVKGIMELDDKGLLVLQTLT